MAIRYRVTLTAEERTYLDTFSKTGKKSAHSVLLARALLLVDQGEYGPNSTEEVVVMATGLSPRSIERLKKRFVEEGLDASLARKKRETPPNPVKFDGKFEAHLIALACTDPPKGYARWTVRLLADKMVELKIVDSVSVMTIHNTLKKTNFSLTDPPTGNTHARRKQFIRSKYGRYPEGISPTIS
jgi:hypothetical protein